MIAHLSGTLLSKHATSVILDVGGVGYEVNIPLSTFYDLGDIGATVNCESIPTFAKTRSSFLVLEPLANASCSCELFLSAGLAQSWESLSCPG